MKNISAVFSEHGITPKNMLIYTYGHIHFIFATVSATIMKTCARYFSFVPLSVCAHILKTYENKTLPVSIRILLDTPEALQQSLRASKSLVSCPCFCCRGPGTCPATPVPYSPVPGHTCDFFGDVNNLKRSWYVPSRPSVFPPQKKDPKI